MANTIASPNMNLPIPVPGVDPGPQWATDNNNCLTLIDQHNHAPGSGVQVGSDGLNIQSPLSLNSTDLILSRSVRFIDQPSVLTNPSDIGCLYEVLGDLYFNDGSSNHVRITQSGGVAGSPGSISNLTSPASASYVSANQTFVWQSDANTPANMDGASYIFRNLVANSKGLTLAPPNSMGADYSITLPALPASTLPLSITASGTMAAAPITYAQLIAAVQQALTPAGGILAYGGAAAPSGFLLCDGSAVSRATYSALFTAISTAYGVGDGSTTFNLPDLRGQFIRGVSGTSGNDPDAADRLATNGGNSGDAVGSTQLDALQFHAHNQQYSAGGSGAGGAVFSGGTGSITTPNTGNITGGSVKGSAFETRPTNVYANFIIKT